MPYESFSSLQQNQATTTTLNQVLAKEKNRVIGRNFVEKFFNQKYEIAKLQVSERMRTKNAKKAAIKLTSLLLGKIPWVGGGVGWLFETIVHDKTPGEILDEALTFYNIADIYAKEIRGEITEDTIKIYVKAQIYLELANSLIEYVEMQQKSFVDGVRLQFSTKEGPVQRELLKVLAAKKTLDLGDLD